VDRLWRAAAQALRMPDVQTRLGGIGAAPGGSTPAATAAFLRQETERWSKVIAQANIKPE
jgi:tripartite-type tricarboxylate transporter receptor subunit TctC